MGGAGEMREIWQRCPPLRYPQPLADKILLPVQRGVESISFFYLQQMMSPDIEYLDCGQFLK